MNAPQRAFVGLGSNLEDPARQVAMALALLDRIDATRMLRSSRLYRTPPWGDTEQPAFVNAVAELETRLDAHALFAHLQRIEAAAGRVRERRWGPRVLDLDLLLYGGMAIGDAGMRVPHPHLHERAFVLLPLAELAPDLEVPGRGRVGTLLAAVDADGIEALG